MHGFDQRHIIIAVFSCTAMSPLENTQQPMFEEAGCQKNVKDGHCVIIFDCTGCCMALEFLNAEGHIPLRNGALYIVEIMLECRESIKPAESINLSNMSRSKSANIPVNMSSMNSKKALISYLGAFEM